MATGHLAGFKIRALFCVSGEHSLISDDNQVQINMLHTAVYLDSSTPNWHCTAGYSLLVGHPQCPPMQGDDGILCNAGAIVISLAKYASNVAGHIRKASPPRL